MTNETLFIAEYKELETRIGVDEADRIIGVDIYCKERREGATKTWMFNEIDVLADVD